MPLLSRNKKDKDKGSTEPVLGNGTNNNNNSTSPIKKPNVVENENKSNNGVDGSNNPKQHHHHPEEKQPPPFVFHCQQAQGSPTGRISNFSNVKELYQRIADCYGFPSTDILFCTLNTHRVDMENLLSAQLCLEDFIFVHRKGIPKEVQVTKTEEALGLTITDNGTGYAFIKRIKDDSIIDRIPSVQVGDHIEGIDEDNLVGWRHVDVAKYLKGIPVGTTFTMRLVEPLKAGFANIAPKSEGRKTKSGKGLGSGKETLRLRSNGTAKMEQAPNELVTTAVDKINRLLENFMGINDVDLATQIWEMAEGKSNTMDFAEAVDTSELESFGFTDDFIIDVWGIVTDARSGRLIEEKPDSPNGFDVDDINEQDLAKLVMNSTPSKKQQWGK